MSDTRATFCQVCHIRSCVQEKGYQGCHECDDWPCEYIESFPVPVGKKVIMRAIPHWREVGAEKYVADEEKRYLCPSCGYHLFRGAKLVPVLQGGSGPGLVVPNFETTFITLKIDQEPAAPMQSARALIWR